MKMTRGIPPILFLSGFATAWLLRPLLIAPTPLSQLPSTSNTSQNPLRITAKTSLNDKRHIPGIVNKIKSMDDTDALSKFLRSIPLRDIPALIESWKIEAGLSGLNDDQKEKIQQLLARWYQEDPTSAIDWLSQLHPKKDAQMLLEKILVIEADRDLHRVADLCEMFGSNEPDGFDFPTVLMKKVSNSDAATVIRFMRAFKRDDTVVQMWFTYNDQFEFSKVAKVLAEDIAANDNAGYAFFPIGFAEEWAKRDVDAAWSWVAANPNTPVVHPSDIFPELTEQRGYKSANEQLIKLLEKQQNAQDRYYQAQRILRNGTSIEQIADFIAQFPGDRQSHLEGLAHSGNFYGSSGEKEYINHLITLMTPEERATVVPKTFGKITDQSQRKNIISTLQQLGHSLQEIDFIMPPVKESQQTEE